MSLYNELLKAAQAEGMAEGSEKGYCLYTSTYQPVLDLIDAQLSDIEDRLHAVETSKKAREIAMRSVDIEDEQPAPAPSREIRGSERLNADPEIVACNAIIQALQVLPDESRRRVMEYAAQRMGLRILTLAASGG